MTYKHFLENLFYIVKSNIDANSILDLAETILAEP